MMPVNNNWIKTGSIVAAIAVILGGMDWLQFSGFSQGESSLNTNAVQNSLALSNAVYFQFVHALAIVSIGILMMLRPGKLLHITGSLFLVGVTLYSGSIYLSFVLDYHWLEYLRLIGVVILVFAWILLLETACPGWDKR